ncbi:hypothetical protein BG004_007158 [Podila humilis]|nr:hypothetical protein BG004_007158 [Podila humilis]
MVSFQVVGGQHQRHKQHQHNAHKKRKLHGHKERVQHFHADKKPHHKVPRQQPISNTTNGNSNSPFSFSKTQTASSSSSSTSSPKSAAQPSSKDKEDPNGFRLPSKILYNPDNVQMNWPQTSTRPVGPGLGNMGNTCFLNSVLQCLTYTPPLAMYLLSSQHGDSCKATGFCMMCLMEKHVMRCFSHSMKEAIYPKVIVGRLRNIAKQFRIGRQEDSHEFARYLIDALQKSCLEGFDSKMDNRIKETSFIHQVFGGYFQSQVKCMECGYESNTYETYLDVSLDIKGTESVQTAFREYIKPEILSKSNQYKCDKCKVLVNARKQMTIYDAPKILSVHLKRFTFTGQKINRHVKFDTKLELNSVMSTNKRHPELNYSLYAVLVHAGGSCHSGHYYCYVKSSNGQWYSMNDSHVMPVSLQTVLGQTAYMLFYAQEKKGSPKSAPVQMKRSRPDADNEAGNKNERDEEEDSDDCPDDNGNKSTLELSKVKRVKVQESNGMLPVSNELTKAERKRIKREKKRTQLRTEQEGKLHLGSSTIETSATTTTGSTKKSQQNDYELATATTTPSLVKTTSGVVVPALPVVKSIFGVPIVQSANIIATAGTTTTFAATGAAVVVVNKNQSPLADLDLKPMANNSKVIHNKNNNNNTNNKTNNPSVLRKPTTPALALVPALAAVAMVEGWKVASCSPKWIGAVDGSSSLQKDTPSSSSSLDKEKKEYVHDGWIVRPVS